MIVKDLYLESIRDEESSLAHYICHLLEEQKISFEDDVSKIDFDQADQWKVAEMIEENMLGFHKVGIYSLKKNEHEFVFIFARSKEQATQFYIKTFQDFPMNCIEYSLDFQLTRGNGVISFREMRKEFEGFPVVAGYFEREWVKENMTETLNEFASV
ncbi:hypothetical protein [Metabacillus halosaccharovorans]|uniref:hypothetical protein n=1 Tax=Metabacillus halosaccharovorans TaxID=930124 RepID=UPI001C1F70B4|nr:hypothetical protein [Metabacillus halosaccharovorans]MBU7592882.1 hypothetical protein [Metabacillus halosaccharovorans]